MASQQKNNFLTDSFETGTGLRSFLSDVVCLSEFPRELIALLVVKLNAN